MSLITSHVNIFAFSDPLKGLSPRFLLKIIWIIKLCNDYFRKLNCASNWRDRSLLLFCQHVEIYQILASGFESMFLPSLTFNLNQYMHIYWSITLILNKTNHYLYKHTFFNDMVSICQIYHPVILLRLADVKSSVIVKADLLCFLNEWFLFRTFRLAYNHCRLGLDSSDSNSLYIPCTNFLSNVGGDLSCLWIINCHQVTYLISDN